MPRRKRTAADIRKRFEGRDWGEVLSALSYYFCQGRPPSELQELLKKKFGLELTREMPWQLLTQAAAEGLFRYEAPIDYERSERLQKHHYPYLKEVKIVRTLVLEDVAVRAARVLLDLVCDKAAQLRGGKRSGADEPRRQSPHGRRTSGQAGKGTPVAPEQGSTVEVHIGFSGGRHLRRLAKEFADLLMRPTGRALPDKITFHAMIGTNLEKPKTNPSSFFSYFEDDVAFDPLEIGFVGFPVPQVVKTKHIKEMYELLGIAHAREQLQNLHIIVAGAGNWADPHNAVRNMLTRWSPSSFQQLDEAGCIGDLQWYPLGREGILDVKTEVRPMTLIHDLSELSDRIKAGTDVLLAVGPCADCRLPKQPALEVILNLDPHVVTHLVTDSRSVPQSTPPRWE
jgi:hypothetical protein